MRKIINNKSYDTSTAEKVGGWENNCSTSDFDYCSEDLYRKRSGEFFLQGSGGSASKYAISVGNSEWRGGEKIIPLSYEAAQEWAQTHLSSEEYEKIFGEISEDGSRTVITLSLSSAAVERAKRNAAKAGMLLSAYIESVI